LIKKNTGAFSSFRGFAASIVASNYAEDLKNGVLTATVSTGINNIIIAQQVAMIAAISAFTVAAASSPS
jgi:hypothetical protein